MTSSTTTAQTLIDSDIDCRRCVRSALTRSGAHDRTAIRVVAGRQRPTLRGEHGYSTWTPSPDGERVRSTGATKWRTYYHLSTIEIEVGADWVRRHCPVPWLELERAGDSCPDTLRSA